MEAGPLRVFVNAQQQSKSFFKTFKKPSDKILLMVRFCRTGARIKGPIVIKLFPNGFQGSIIVGDALGSLFETIDLFLELCYAEKVTLRKPILQIVPHIDSMIKINNALSDGL